MIRKILLTFLFICASFEACAQNIWDEVQKFATPAYRAEIKDGAAEIYFENVPYKGKPTEVFAYYCTPGILKADRSIDKNLPAVVCVHGGGGKAYKEWVQIWAKRGYAAIALDWRGNGPDAKPHAKSGPEHNYDNIVITDNNPLKDTWTYHAVSAICRAHSLILSFPEVDNKKSAVTGVSWGGFLTSIIVGVDNRYKAAVPVYGCGFIFESDIWNKATVKESNPEHYKFWLQNLDPSVSLKRETVPMFFINGTNDKWYALSIWTQSVKAAKGAGCLVVQNLGHSHKDAWKVEEVYAFIDSKLKNAPALPKVSVPKFVDGGFEADFKTSSPAKSAEFYYTQSQDTVWEKREWKSLPAKLEGGKLRVLNAPENLSAYFFQVTDARGMRASSIPVFKN